jgi:hypothetical protein
MDYAWAFKDTNICSMAIKVMNFILKFSAKELNNSKAWMLGSKSQKEK